MWKWKFENIFYMNKSFYGKCFFLICSSNSVYVDFVIDGDDDVGDTDDDE